MLIKCKPFWRKSQEPGGGGRENRDRVFKGLDIQWIEI